MEDSDGFDFQQKTDEPLSTIVFKYRSRGTCPFSPHHLYTKDLCILDALKTLHMIPHSASNRQYYRRYILTVGSFLAVSNCVSSSRLLADCFASVTAVYCSN
jgi:hypothetical protein